MIFRATNSISSYCPFKSFKLGQPWISLGIKAPRESEGWRPGKGFQSWTGPGNGSNLQHPPLGICAAELTCAAWSESSFARTYFNCLNWHPNKQDKSFDVIPYHTIVFDDLPSMYAIKSSTWCVLPLCVPHPCRDSTNKSVWPWRPLLMDWHPCTYQP